MVLARIATAWLCGTSHKKSAALVRTLYFFCKKEKTMRLQYAELDLEFKAHVSAAEKTRRDRKRLLPISPLSETVGTKREKYKVPEETRGEFVDIII